MQIELINIEKLIPYAMNARTHSDAQVAQIAGSIKEFGFTNPALIDENDGLIAGHGRLLAARKLGITEIPCIRLSHLNEIQKKAYILADNRIALNSGWDVELLKVELEKLQVEDFDLNMLGFDDVELSEILDPEIVNGKTDEDSVPEVPDEPKTKLGDIYILGNHRLMCGDSTSIDAVEKLMDGNKADMVFTDPPYGVNYQSNMRTKSPKYDVIKNDDVILDIVPIIEIFSKGWVFIWTTWKVLDKWLENTKGLGFPNNMVIWHKGGGGIGDLKKTFSTDYETALVWNRGAELCGKRIGSVWKVGKDNSVDYVHPTQKPVALAQEALDKTTNRNSIILDLFGGSGSTLIACEKLSRFARVMELDPRYCDVIVKRWEDFTGNKAELISDND